MQLHLQAEPELSPLEAQKCILAPLQPLKTLSHPSALAAVSATAWLLLVWDSFQMGKMAECFSLGVLLHRQDAGRGKVLEGPYQRH